MGKNPALDQFPNVLSQGVKVSGEIHFEQDAYIDGAVEGNLQVDGALVLGEHGCVGASITAQNMVIEGRVKGKIHCAGLLKIAATALIEGDIETTLLSVDEGAVVHGKLTMQSAKEDLGVQVELPTAKA